MANKEKNQDILVLSQIPEDYFVVQKSHPLLNLWNSPFTLIEFKILDLYLARINSHEPDKRTVVIRKGELEKIFGVDRIRRDVLKKRLDNLLQTLEIPLSDGSDGTKKLGKVNLFEVALAEQDETTGIWTVSLTCTQTALNYFFNVDQLGYLRYKLRSIINLSSRSTYLLFLYLEKNRYRMTWREELSDLKEFLGCSNDVSYEEFKLFNNRILKKGQKELTEKLKSNSEQYFTYETIRTGRSVSAIKFTLSPLDDKDSLPEAAEEVPAWYEESIGDPLALLSDACENEFSREQIAVIMEVLRRKNLPEDEYGIDTARYRYLRQKYAQLNLRAQNDKIKHRHSYFIKMLENDQL